ncbi:hypothetical protein JR316_0003034 [Psilocybe cubensis]|uniref:Uncharacterized protein n=2 Tax=Psilocybe cubensis TaxID=181762 RepID=A0ACB8H6U8_PSICU|nr:hypothetical protein JR316_0003034 [Psilocybe cubensis]KAH9483564.1 hypothetical protein JR316_0003034 [Psilocybe cubensis]
MKFLSAIALALSTLPFMASAAATAPACSAFCCDAVVPSVRPGGNVGINCTPGGLDCGFHGQTTACCVRLTPIGARTGTAVGCN